MRTAWRRLLILSLAGCLIIGVKMTALAAAAPEVTTTEETTTAATETPTVPADFTGIYNLQFYKNGKPVQLEGWKKYGDEYYFFKDNKALTGWNYVKSLSGGKARYKYYFDKDGKLSQNLFKTFGAKIRRKKLKVFVNLTTHNITIYLYDKKKHAYNTPAKTWVCSTARDGRSTTPGNFYLAKGTATAWFIYKKTDPYPYYQYKVKIRGTRMLFHSEMYSGTSKNRLIASTYNALGTNQTTRCIRSQCGNAYLLYRIAKENKNPIPVKIYRSKNKGPFGKKTLANSGGKINRGQ
ncbi:MAG: L,D-transpeptidase [Eubacterium sp.]|nr:L,D-transpeptidase [Eubacterium sp.]